MQYMQRDLKNYFGYDVTVEHRKMPYWKLTSTSKKAGEKLRTKGGERNVKNIYTDLECKNIPISVLVERLYHSRVFKGRLPLIDETGITHHIDITFDALMSDSDEVRKSLRTNGLDVVKAYKDMQVIVIETRNDIEYGRQCYRDTKNRNIRRKGANYSTFSVSK